ncbi:MAG: tetratricopeptide repeat protein [Sphingobium sp.]
MDDPTFEEINGWSAEETRSRMAASPEAAAVILRVSAEAGMVDAQALYGQILLDGQGVPRDPAEALRWFAGAARAGHVMAMNMVGRCCEHGWGTRVDKALAARWYRAAADRGLDWAQYNLATLHCLGEGVELDREEALRLYRSAADRGHAKSVTMIGGFHEDGWVVRKDMRLAADHYRRGAEAGDFRGQFNHARMLIDAGEIDVALHWLGKLPEKATPAFLSQVRGWLRGRAEPALNALADRLANGT